MGIDPKFASEERNLHYTSDGIYAVSSINTHREAYIGRVMCSVEGSTESLPKSNLIESSILF